MARLDLAPAVRAYLERHAVDVELALELGVRSGHNDSILYPYKPPRGEPYDRVRDLETGITKQPKGEELILWWPAGRPDAGAEVILAEGEPDALAALSALNGDPYAVCAIPGTTIPPERVAAELGAAGCVYICLDGDAAGRRAGDKIARALQRYTPLKVVRLGEGEDLASRLVREEDPRAWLRDALANAPVAPKVKLKAEEGGYRKKAADRTRDLLARGIDPERLDLAELLDRLVAYVETYVVLPVVEKGGDRYERAVANLLGLWIMHTWAFPAWWATPYLRIVSAAPESAKSLLMEVLSDLCRASWLAVNPSPAVLYRFIDRHEPSLFLDELDNFGWDERRDALAVLNNGYRPGFKVARCNEKGDLEEFGCYCPKAFAGLDAKQMPPALLSRSITVRMEPKRAGEPVENYIAPDAGPRAEELRECCRAWAERHVDELRGHRPDLVGLTNRRAEVWWPLLVLGEYAGGEWQDRAQEAARAFGAGGDETDRPAEQVQLLMDIDAAFGNETAIFTADLLTYLNNLDESPWGDRRRGDGLDARGLANLLRPFRIRPKEVRVGDEHKKGYHVDQFAEVFDRYLPDPPTSATSATSATTAPPSQANVADVADVTDTEGPSHAEKGPGT
jgi:hypothetical protein